MRTFMNTELPYLQVTSADICKEPAAVQKGELNEEVLYDNLSEWTHRHQGIYVFIYSQVLLSAECTDCIHFSYTRPLICSL